MGTPGDLSDRPSPFAADTMPAGGGSTVATPIDARLLGPSASRHLAARPSRQLAWEEAWEEAADAPIMAAAFSSALPSYYLSHQQLSLVPGSAEELGLKAVEQQGGWGAWRGEAARLLDLAVPLAVGNLGAFAISAVGISFVGRLGGLQLSAVVLAASVFNVTGQSVMMGLCGTIDTLAGQAFGARNFKAVGTILQRALLVNVLFGAIIALAWLRCEALFLALGQEEQLSAAAARYMALVAPSLPFIGVFEACKRSLIVQGVVRPATIVTTIAAALTPLYNWLLIVRLGLGLEGAALAVDALQFTCAALMGGYLIARNRRQCGQPESIWGGWSWAAVRGWRPYLALALPSVIMICCKWWSFEALLLMSGWMPDAQVAVATMGICSVTNSIIFMPVFGISVAASVRISNSLGAGCPHSARRAVLSSLAMALALVAVAITALLTLQGRWFRLLTDVEPVVEAAVKLLPIFCLSLVGDNANVALQALLRGAGKQKVGALTNIFSYWALAIPLAHHLAFTQGMGLQGLWYGAAAANLAVALILLAVVLRFDYAGAAAQAAVRYGLQEPLLPDAHEQA